jgi:hypothetical protein
MLVTSVSFFNEVSTEMEKSILRWFHFLTSLKLENYAQVWFHFLTSLKSKNHAHRPLFHFLTRLRQRRKNYPWKPLFHVLTRLLQRHKNYPRKPLFLIMDSKRTMLWNDTMSRDKTRSWIPRGLHWKEETHSGRTPCQGSQQELRYQALTTLSKRLPCQLLDLSHQKLKSWVTTTHN